VVHKRPVALAKLSVPTHQKLKIDKDRKRILELKARSRKVADKGKHTLEASIPTCTEAPLTFSLCILSMRFP
jgi:hypothetical protein